MNIYEINELGELLKNNTYPGRGIVVGKSANGKAAVIAYFIMGRSENSRNRVFSVKNGDIVTEPFDYSKVQDPSLIIYSPVKRLDKKLIVTNGDQTETIYQGLLAGKSFEDALMTRKFEPDAPNFTPRISAMLDFENGYKYKMSILKSADEKGSACNRYTYNYSPVAGLGHFIHTYNKDGNPIPTFTGEPERINILNSIDAFTNKIWNNLNEDNKISIYVRYVSLKSGRATVRMINKNVK